MGEQWHLVRGGRQSGPHSFDELKQLLTGSDPAREQILVWTEQLQAWSDPRMVPGLLGSPALAPAPSGPPSRPLNPYETPASALAVSTSTLARSDSRFRPKPANFWLLVSFYVVGFLLMILSAVALAVLQQPQSGVDPQVAGTIGGIGVLAGLVLFTWASVLILIYLYRAWKIVHPAHARTTPGKAVGFLFIPFFNLYWIFEAYRGWAVDYNKTAIVLRGKQRPDADLFLAYCILSVGASVPYLGFLAALPLMAIAPLTLWQMCQVINEHADAPV